jgi:ATP-binding cassette, subfamily B, bacterial
MRRPAHASDLALYGRLLGYARPYWPHIVGLFLLGLLAGPIALLNPVPLKIAVDSVLGSEPLPGFLRALLPAGLAASRSDMLWLVVVMLIVVAVLAQLREVGYALLKAYVGERLSLDFRARLFDRAQRLSLRYHDSVGTADTLYRIQHDTSALNHIALDSVIPFVSAVATVAGMVYVSVRIDWQLALVALSVAPVLFILSGVIRARVRTQSRNVKRLESGVLAVIQETMGALREVKAFGQEGRETARFVKLARMTRRARLRLALVENAAAVVVGLVTAIGMALVVYIGVNHVSAGVITLGQLLLIAAYLGQLYSPLRTISRRMTSVQSQLVSGERALALLDEPIEVAERPDARPLERARGEVAFRQVSFGYDPDHPVLRDISFEVASGSRIAITGTTGAGKTTLVNLLTRFYDPTAGEILLDGVDVRDYRVADLRSQFAIVLQQPVLFSTTIADNIAYARPGATAAQIEAAARAANAHDFISALPGGYGAQVGERGMKVSGGERQRIALARAFLKDAPILILDEPTSSVDVKTEATILEALERLMQGRTVFLITHRPTAEMKWPVWLQVQNGRLWLRSPAPEAVSNTAPPEAGARSGFATTNGGSRAADESHRALHAEASPVTRNPEGDQHPAIAAWRVLEPDRQMPSGVEPVRVKKPAARSAVYRLLQATGDGAPVIAKRYGTAVHGVERIIYEEVLPLLPVSSPRYYGAVVDGDERAWIFLEDAGSERLCPSDPRHRLAAGRWLATLHIAAAELAVAGRLPDHGPARYRRHLEASRRLLLTGLDNGHFSKDEGALLQAIVAQCDTVEQRWDEVEEICAAAPLTLVHGDFQPKNVLVKDEQESRRLLVIDWETCGWGVAAADLAPARHAHAPQVDLDEYCNVMRERWPHIDAPFATRLVQAGLIFRQLAAIEWAAISKVAPRTEGVATHLDEFRVYRRELDQALTHIAE